MAVARSPAPPRSTAPLTAAPRRVRPPATLPLLHPARRALRQVPRFLVLGALGCLFALAVAIALLANVVRPG